MGMSNIPGIPSINDDDGSTIRSNNFANLLPGQTAGLTKEQIFTKTHGYPSTCILISNMFDPNEVDLEQDPDFYLNIKQETMDLCQENHKVDRIFVEKKSTGHVWIKFSGASN